MAADETTAVPATEETPPEAAATSAAPAAPSAEHLAEWQALEPDQRLALREREAVRMFAQGLEHHQKGALEEALKVYGQALLLNPKLSEVYINMGVALRALGNLEASVACYRRALVHKPDNATAYTNLGNVLSQLGRFVAATAAHRQAVKLAPDSAEAHYNLGLVLRDTGESEEAVACFDKALELNPEHPACRWDRSLSLLQKGDLKTGFEEYEWRWKLSDNPPREFTQPLWDGADLKGKTILLHHEQGFGDMIHFARYIPMVKAKGGTIVVEAPAALGRLFSTIDGIGQVVNAGSDLPKFDVYAPMMSLARIFGTTSETIPAAVPYLKAPDAHAVQLPATMSKHRKIGIAWAGRPTHQNDSNRSCSFNHFIELMGMPETTLYSLQYGPAADDIAARGCEAMVMNLGNKLRDFADTAAVISQLDMVISVDTAIAHLAGAMGKPVWVVVPYPGDWRWMLDRDDSPWYPTARLFRQNRPGSWEPVFDRLRRALHDEITGKA
jgi:tetratricopeptide (TPR) repeat protein